MSSLFSQGARVALQSRAGCALLLRAPPLKGTQLVRVSSSSGPTGSHPVPLALKKRGYDVTRNPHLNKCQFGTQSCNPVFFWGICHHRLGSQITLKMINDLKPTN